MIRYNINIKDSMIHYLLIKSIHIYCLMCYRHVVNKTAVAAIESRHLKDITYVIDVKYILQGDKKEVNISV